MLLHLFMSTKWADLHSDELLGAWDMLREGKSVPPVEELR